MTAVHHPWQFNDCGDLFTLASIEPPRDWTNVHYAERGKRAYYSLFNHAGAGSVFVRDEHGNQTSLTSHGERCIYFSDDTGKTWTIADYPVCRGVSDYRCEYTNAYTKLESTFQGIRCSQRMFVPLESLFEIWTVEVTNETSQPKTISIHPYSSIDLMGFPILFRYGQTRMRWTFYHEEIQGLLTKNNSPFAPSDIYAAFLISSETPVAATGKPSELFTPPYSFAHPNLHGNWIDRFINGYDSNCMCLRVPLTLNPGEKKVLHFAYGSAPEVDAIKPIFNIIKDSAAVERLLAEVTSHYARMNAQLQVNTGDSRIDRYMNQWAPKQIESYLTFKKAWRDNLQIDMEFGGMNYAKALDNLLDALSYQYEEGHCPHSFRPVVTHQYSDKPAWIPMAVAELIKESGDFSILDIQLPYIDAKLNKTTYTESVLDHVMRAMRFMFNDTGIHEMCRMHYADWLDGLDGLSRVGEGESVLTTLMFAAGLLDLIGLAEAAGKNEIANEARQMHAEVKRRLNDHAWDGEWFMRGFSGNGETVGSKDNKYGQIFLNSQSWAIIGGVADEEQQRKMLASVDRILDTELGRRLYYPPYKEYYHHIGCISAQPPDYAMNAIYNHACTFSIVADCLAGRAEKAWGILSKVIPDGENNPSSQSKNEPFSVTNSFKLEKNYYGECGEAWRTNTAAWAYRGLTEFILGIRKDYAGLRIQPCLPAHLKKVSVRRVFRGGIYNIEIRNESGAGKEVKSIEVNGQKIAGNLLPLAQAGEEMHITAVV